MSLYTDGTYLQHNPTWHSEDAPWKVSQILQMIHRHQLAPHTVCEVGCGAGGILESLAQALPAGTAFYGYEISQAAFQLCLERQAVNLHFYLADLLQTENPPFDLLLAIDVIEHVEDVFGFLRRLRPKAGLKLFHLPLDFTLINLLRPHILTEMRQSIGHIHYFTKDTALAILAETGYQGIDWFYTPWAFELGSTTRKMARLNGARRLLFHLNPDLAVRLLGGFSLMVLAR
jgi:SAM-dependent methyltransferase